MRKSGQWGGAKTEVLFHPIRLRGKKVGRTIVELDHITKSFAGIKALDNVHLDLQEGELHALMGENGAGKSTLMKILTGVYSKDSGTIKLLNEASDSLEEVSIRLLFTADFPQDSKKHAEHSFWSPVQRAP